jgi:hypothetical protein
VIAAELAGALQRAVLALEAGEAVGAAAALAEAGRRCDDARRRGSRLDPAAVASLLALHARCEVAAAVTSARLGRALHAAGSARRAASAYGG